MEQKQIIIISILLLIVGIIFISKAMYGFGTNKGKQMGMDTVCKTITDKSNMSAETKCACSPDCCVDDNGKIVNCK